MKLDIEIDESELKTLVLDHIQSKLGVVEIGVKDLKIEVKSKQNFRSEWEEAAFRASLHATRA